jgi:hypothetical protein
MKTKILICAALAVGLITAAATLPASNHVSERTVFTRPNPVFDFVRGHRQGKGVTMTWGSSASSSSVNCFTLIRTYEDPTDPYAEWNQVGNIPCNASRSYKVNDESVSPGFVSYRVVASLIGGGYEFSDVETIHVVQH